MRTRSFLCILIALGFGSVIFLAPMSGNAALYTADLTFETSDQSMWGSGGATTLDFNHFYGATWDESGGVGGVAEDVTTPAVTIPPICTIFGCTPEIVLVEPVNLGDYGARVDASTNGEVGFQVDLHFDSGSVDVGYPVGIDLNFPDPNTVLPGETFSISSSFTPSTAAAMTTNFPEASLSLDLIFDVYADAHARVCLVDCFVDTDLFPTIDVDETINLIDLDSNTGQLELETFGGLVPITVQVPDINTTGTVSGNNIHSSGEDLLLDVDVDLDLILTSALGLPPLGADLSFGAATIEYEILDILAGYELNVTQEFGFEPTLMGQLDLSTGDSYEFTVGDPVDIVFPASLTDLEITPTFWLENTFENETGLRIDPNFTLEVLSLLLGLDLPDVVNLLGLDDISESLGPAYILNLTTEGPAIALLSKSWELQGFEEIVGSTFLVSALVQEEPGPEAVPEPGTLLLLGAGLLGLATFGRRRVKKETA